MNWKKKTRWLNRQVGLEKRDPLPRHIDTPCVDSSTYGDVVEAWGVSMADAAKAFREAAEALASVTFSANYTPDGSYEKAKQLAEEIGIEVPYDYRTFLTEWGFEWNGSQWVDTIVQ